MKGLSEQHFWHGRWSAKQGGKTRLKRFLAKPGVSRWIGPYKDHLLWNGLLPRYLPADPERSFLEVGSAPGWFLLRIHETFGYRPYGIEYAESGVELNREVFVANGLPAEQVMHGDFFSEELFRDHADRYEVVCSRGFIEHFDDPKSVVERHLALVKEGGTLYISIPNLRGFNYLYTWIVERHVLAVHNLEIMSLPAFRALFELPGLELKFCGYSGTFDLGLVSVHGIGWKKVIVYPLAGVQLCLNLLFRVLLGKRGLESCWFSPRLVFLGTKPSPDQRSAAASAAATSSSGSTREASPS